MNGDPIPFPPQERSGPIEPKAGEVVSLDDSRPPIWYDIAVCHHHDGTVETFTRGVTLDTHTRSQIAVALRAVADGIEAIRDEGEDK